MGEDAADGDDLTAGDYLKITVSDTGPGIAPQIIHRIFDPYFTTREMGKGSGIMLSIVHGIVKNYNGAISVDSKPGKGTTFTLLFPVVTEKPDKKIRRDIPIIIGTGHTSLMNEEKVKQLGIAGFVVKPAPISTIANAIRKALD